MQPGLHFITIRAVTLDLDQECMRMSVHLCDRRASIRQRVRASSRVKANITKRALNDSQHSQVRIS